MFCRYCGEKLRGQEEFCPKGGNSVLKQSNKNREEIERQKKMRSKILFISMCFVVLTVGGTAAYQFVFKDMFSVHYLAQVKNEKRKWLFAFCGEAT